MTTRTRNLLVLLAVFALAGVGFALSKPSAPARVRPLDAIPAESFLVVTVDVDELRASPVARPLIEGALGTDTEACGIELLLRVNELALAFPEGEGDFGVAVGGSFEREALVACAKKVIAARGGEPRVSDANGFTVIENTAPTRRADALPKLVLADRGLLLIGRGPWLDAMMATRRGERPGLEKSPEHAALRAPFAAPRERRPMVLATAVLPRPMREQLGDEIAAGEARASAVLGVETAGLAVVAAGANREELELRAELHCDRPDACAQVRELLERRRRQWSQDVAVRLLGLSAVVEALAVDVQGTTLSARTHMPARDLSSILGRALDAPAERRDRPPPAATAADEVLRPRRTNTP